MQSPARPALRRRARSRAADPARIIAYDFETAPIRSGTPRPLYLTAYGKGMHYASPIRSMAHLRAELVQHFLTEANEGATFVAWNGNRFDGPELILMDNDKVVETKGRSTIVITNTGGSDNTAGSGSGQESAPTGPVTANTPIAGRPEYAGSSIETK